MTHAGEGDERFVGHRQRLIVQTRQDRALGEAAGMKAPLGIANQDLGLKRPAGAFDGGIDAGNLAQKSLAAERFDLNFDRLADLAPRRYAVRGSWPASSTDRR